MSRGIQELYAIKGFMLLDKLGGYLIGALGAAFIVAIVWWLRAYGFDFRWNQNAINISLALGLQLIVTIAAIIIMALGDEQAEQARAIGDLYFDTVYKSHIPSGEKLVLAFIVNGVGAWLLTWGIIGELGYDSNGWTRYSVWFSYLVLCFVGAGLWQLISYEAALKKAIEQEKWEKVRKGQLRSESENTAPAVEHQQPASQPRQTEDLSRKDPRDAFDIPPQRLDE
ncbi:hypothetical protein [Pseudaestuariivita atlantica]|uniref:Uncharacterized protein n=1 Tax=Pseudaestuariivita atlantica TaxID=1317121 RepID=A0A0L1JK70_9RHOB|nr:hypothetical protein [Pseudaestuariivita atlantica]KNG91803.1 hypothetical protein ATO11_20765 [Pseudaestuariivita atlantica]